MKIKVDDKEVLNLSATQKKVIMNDIHEDSFVQDMERRVAYILQHKYERCMERLKTEWKERLNSRYESIPTSDEALAELIFSQPEYKSRKARDLEAEEARGNVS